MSADNGYVIRKNSHDKYTLQMYFASDDVYPEIIEDESGPAVFDSLEDAVLEYEKLEKTTIVEYGLSIQVTPSQNPTKEN